MHFVREKVCTQDEIFVAELENVVLKTEELQKRPGASCGHVPDVPAAVSNPKTQGGRIGGNQGQGGYGTGGRHASGGWDSSGG